MNLFQIVLCALTYQASYQAAVKERIFFGTKAGEKQFPYQVQLMTLRINNYEMYNCGGSLISSKYVLTAAHCLKDKSGYPVRAVAMAFGSIASKDQALQNALEQGGHFDKNIQVCGQCWLSHPDYKNQKPYWGDIAIIYLPRIVEFTETIRPVKLPFWSDTEWQLIGKPALVAGWGLTEHSPDKGPESLLYMPLTITKNSECNYDIPEYYRKGQICIKRIEARTICKGDSGSPLVVDNKQVGIVSYIKGDCLQTPIGVYTSVIAYLDWIWKNTDLRTDN